MEFRETNPFVPVVVYKTGTSAMKEKKEREQQPL
jgi:hypothetical protein